MDYNNLIPIFRKLDGLNLPLIWIVMVLVILGSISILFFFTIYKCIGILFTISKFLIKKMTI